MPDDEARIARLEAAVAKNATAIHALSARLTELHETSARAVRTAQESVQELESISEGLMRHIRAADEARAEETIRLEKVRSTAAASHAKRFDDMAESLHRQGETLTGQGETLKEVVSATNTLSKSVKANGKYRTIWIVLAILLGDPLRDAVIERLFPHIHEPAALTAPGVR